MNPHLRKENPDPSYGECPDCGKVRYLSRRDARRAVARMKGNGGKARHAYRCGDYWHLTSRPAVVVTAYRDYNAGRPPTDYGKETPG